MGLNDIIVIIFFITVMQFLLMWLPFYMDFSDYTNEGKDAIWITKNRNLNWFLTLFLIPHAVMYKNLCERVNGDGLALLLVLLTLITLPLSLLMSLIGVIILGIWRLWRCFCCAFAREEEP